MTIKSLPFKERFMAKPSLCLREFVLSLPNGQAGLNNKNKLVVIAKEVCGKLRRNQTNAEKILW
jgi:hypothetical protein